MVWCALHTPFTVTDLPSILAKEARFITVHAHFLWVAVGCKPRFASGSTRDGSVSEVLQERRIVRSEPATRALGWICGRALVAWVIALKLGREYEVVQLVHDEVLLIVPIRLNHKAVSRLVVDRVLHVSKFDCDLSRVRGKPIEDIDDSNCACLSVNLAVGVKHLSRGDLAGSRSPVDQSDLLGELDFNAAGRGHCVYGRELDGVVSDRRRCQ